MATASQIRHVARMVTDLQERISICAPIAQALIETNQQWWRRGFSEVFHPTEFQRARNAVLEMSRQSRAEIQRLRRETLSPDLIRAGAQIEKVIECCERCPFENRHCTSGVQPFTCLFQSQFGHGQNGSFRFQLSVEGQIIERR